MEPDESTGRGDEDGSRRLPYASSYHVPVLCHAVVEGLVTDPAGVYIDGTLGGGGHAAALLDALAPAGRVVGVDQDPDALAAAEARLAEAVEAGRFATVRGNFGDLEALLREAGVEAPAGILLDLGVSSHQLDTAGRGFSYQAEGALDMRMDPRSGLSAHEIVNGWDEAALRQLLFEYGEEPRAARIVRAILASRPIETTDALADVVRQAVPVKDELKSLARVFQAVRIAVNAELEVLERVLAAAQRVLPLGGRMAVISYHSLEDRRVKRIFRHGNLEGRPVRDLYGHHLTPWHELTRKPITAGEDEVAANPRARSARLRIAERVEEPSAGASF